METGAAFVALCHWRGGDKPLSVGPFGAIHRVAGHFACGCAVVVPAVGAARYLCSRKMGAPFDSAGIVGRRRVRTIAIDHRGCGPKNAQACARCISLRYPKLLRHSLEIQYSPEPSTIALTFLMDAFQSRVTQTHFVTSRPPRGALHHPSLPDRGSFVNFVRPSRLCIWYDPSRDSF